MWIFEAYVWSMKVSTESLGVFLHLLLMNVLNQLSTSIIPSEKQIILYVCIYFRGKGKNILNMFNVCLTNRKNKPWTLGIKFTVSGAATRCVLWKKLFLKGKSVTQVSYCENCEIIFAKFLFKEHLRTTGTTS